MRILIALLGAGAFTAALAGSPITDSASAVDAAKRYVRARCTAETPCRFKPEREGRRWRVWVRLGERNTRGKIVYPSPGKSIVLFFDDAGNLIRRLEAE
ncbi:MAG TPA: hypothetical protein VLS49_13620 [Usitatibacter sp.]|nr:hypothetical protein [Usitatibacter sp.]